MLLKLRPLLLLLAILWSVRRTRNSPRYLRIYLLAEFATTLIVETVAQIAGWGSWAYTGIYIAARFVELAAAFMLGQAKLPGLGFAVAITVIAMVGMHHASFYSWLSLLEGAGFLLVGASLLIRADFHCDELTGRLLAILWLFLGVFDFGYAMNYGRESWMELNQWWPSLACILCFLAVGVFRAPLKPMIGLGQKAVQE